MKRFFLTLATALIVATGAWAQETVDQFDIAVNVEDEAEQATVITLATTFALLAPRTSGVRKASRFEFQSGAGLVEGNAATDKLRAQLPEPLALSVDKLDSIGTPCDISRHRFDDTDVLLVVHDSTSAQPQDVIRCFIAGMWIYHTGGAESITINDWRQPYARILGSLSSGRPAFAGFSDGEN